MVHSDFVVRFIILQYHLIIAGHIYSEFLVYCSPCIIILWLFPDNLKYLEWALGVHEYSFVYVNLCGLVTPTKTVSFLFNHSHTLYCDPISG